jgi:aryl-alcohol dehydrogenase
MAKEFGATTLINTNECDDVVAKIKEITNGGAEHSIDTTGVPQLLKQALASVGFLGNTVVLGATGEMNIHVLDELMGECKSLLGVIEGDSVPKEFIPELLKYHKKGKFPFDRMIEYFDFKDINKVFKDVEEGKIIKAVLRMD